MTVCSSCGEQNEPEAQFCSSCSAYLGWQDHPPPRVTTPAGGPAPDEPRARPGDAEEPQNPFEAGVEDSDLTVPLDGSPATVTVNLANTSTIVDGYVVEVLDAPPWLTVRSDQVELLPGTQGIVTAQLRIDSAILVPAQEVAVLLRARNTTGRKAHRDLPVRVTVPVVDAPVELRAEPRLLRARDGAAGVCTVVVDNSRSNRWARVRLSAGDPEHVVRATWVSPQLQVPPGGEARTEVRFEAPPADPGAELSRTITVTATEGGRSATTTVTLVQATGRAAIELLTLRLDPSKLRLGGRHQGHLTATVDNRRGVEPVLVSLSGDDPEDSLRFAFSPASVQVQPGAAAAVRVTVTAPRTVPGQEVTRPLTIVASDGRADARAEGSVIQLSPSRRGLVRVVARVLLIVLGALAIVRGAWLPLYSGGDSDRRAVDLTVARLATALNVNRDSDNPFIPVLVAVEDRISSGLILVVLAALMVFGLTGSGKLSRLAALLGIAVVVASFVGVASLGDSNSISVASGAVLVVVGCIAGYIGGHLGRR